MWRPSEEIQADLKSGDANRIAIGLRDLEECMESVVDEFEIPPLDLSLLQPFEGAVPEAVLKSFIRLVDGYQSFKPPLTKEDRLYRLAEVAVTCGNDWAALEAALSVKSSDTPVAKLNWVLSRMRARGLRSDTEVRGAANYLSYLISGSTSVRAAVLAELKRWNHGILRRAVERILPELEDEEVKMLSF
jgi:hypothetical protein